MAKSLSDHHPISILNRGFLDANYIIGLLELTLPSLQPLRDSVTLLEPLPQHP